MYGRDVRGEMALHIVRTQSDRLVSFAVLSELRGALECRRRAVLLLPSFEQALVAQQDILRAGIGIGVRCTTPSNFVRELWEIWGDGTHITDDVAQWLFARQTIVEDGHFEPNPGTVSLLCKLIRKASPWINQSTNFKGLTDAERKLVSLASRYHELLNVHDLIEEACAMLCLPSLMQKQGLRAENIVAVGFSELSRPLREMLIAYATDARVTLVMKTCLNSALDITPALIDRMQRAAENHQIEAHLEDIAASEDTRLVSMDSAQTLVSDIFEPGSSEYPRRACELEELIAKIFDVETAGSVRVQNAVSLVLPAGPLAEAEAITQQIERLSAEGCSDIVVCVPDVRRAWRELSPKLLARDLSCEMQLSVPLSELDAGRAFLEFIENVSRLVRLRTNWPASIPLGKDVKVALADMSWWPPHGLSDFLMCDIAHVPAGRAALLDASWRSNRLLTPQAVLDDLCSEKLSSPSVAQATRELLRGRIGSSASKLLAPYIAMQTGENYSDERTTQATIEAKAVLSEVIACTSRLYEVCGFTVKDEPEAILLKDLVELSSPLLAQRQVVLRLRVGAPSNSSPSPKGFTPCSSTYGEGVPRSLAPTAPTLSRCRARILSKTSAKHLAPCSSDALIICGMTSRESPVRRDPLLSDELIGRMGIEPMSDSMADLRTGFAALLAVPRRQLILERCLRAADGKDAYSSVELIEALACYGVKGGAKPDAFHESVLSVFGTNSTIDTTETCVMRNASLTGKDLIPLARETPAPAGKISKKLQDLVLVSATSVAGSDLPLLSASQIETYLECPYKWFSLKRLRLDDANARFSSVEKGAFAHRVLEVTHAQMLGEAVTLQADLLLREAQLRGVFVPLIPNPADPKGPKIPDLLGLARAMGDLRLAGSKPQSKGLADEGFGSLAHAHDLLDAEFDKHLTHQFVLKGGRKPQPLALVAHTAQDQGGLDMLRQDLHSFLDYESRALLGFEPRFFEWTFGRGDDVVEYAGARIVGTVDRIDIDAHGLAVVIDYKHKSASSFAREYDAFTNKTPQPKQHTSAKVSAQNPSATEVSATQDAPVAETTAHALPRRVQSLIYGQVVRKKFPQLKVTGALYMCTRADHAIAGALARDLAERVYGDYLPKKSRLEHVCVDKDEYSGDSSLGAFLDATEEAIALRIKEMRAGIVQARPIDATACEWCPVLNCEKRISL